MSTSATSNRLPLLDDSKTARRLGTLQAQREGKKIDLPLAGVDIQAKVVGRVSNITIKQVFKNPYKDFLEAVYIFPLAGGVAINKFEMRVGDRVVVGVVDERQAAREQYTQAIQDGKRAALLEQEREDIFTIQVGNIPPDEQVEITIAYSERLPYFDEGKTEMRLPLVIGHRYISGTPKNAAPVGLGVAEDTDVVPDASRITPPRLAAGVKTDIALSVGVEIAADENGLSDLTCSQHATSTAIKPGWTTVGLSRCDELLNRDFVLTWRVATAEISSKFHICKGSDGRDAYGMVTINPPRMDGFTGVARDVVFVLDRSGSMGGIKMVSASRACSILLETLSPRDRFAIIAFDTVNEWLGGKPNTFYNADEEGLERGHKFLREITARGGTELYGALQDSIGALKTCNKKDARLPIIVLLTDGQIGDEARVLKEIQKKLGETRLFTVGIDTAVNTGLLKRLAAVGGGTSAFVQPGSQLEEALIGVGREIGAPLITNISVSTVDEKGAIHQLAPDPVPDLFAGRSVTAFFRLASSESTPSLKITGNKADGTMFEETICAQDVTIDAVPQLWAKTYITYLEDNFRAGVGDRTKLKEEIVSIAKAHSLLTKFTAFVLVDEKEIVNTTGKTRTVVQPVCEPEGWEMTTDSLASKLGAPMGAPQVAFQAAPAAYDSASAPLTLAESVRRKIATDTYGTVQQEFAKQDMTLGGSPAAQSGWSQPQAPAPSSTPSQPQMPPQSAPPSAGSGGGGTWGAPPAAPRSQAQQSTNKSSKHIKYQCISSGNSDQMVSKPQPNKEASASSKTAKLGFWQKLFGKGEQQGLTDNKLLKAIRELFNALENVWAAISEGRTPRAEALSKAREAILRALADDANASELPQLQRFLRVEAMELVAALNSSTTKPADLTRLSETSKSAFDGVKNELQSQFRLDPTTGSSVPFWEESV